MTQAGWQRRAVEWLHQMQTLPIEIQQIELQILGAQRRRDQALQELNNSQRQIEHATEVLDFLRDKFTATELYLWLQARRPPRCTGRCTTWPGGRRGRPSVAFNFERRSHAGGSSRRRPGTTCTTGCWPASASNAPCDHGEGLPRREPARVRADQAHLAAAATSRWRTCGCGPPAAARSTSRSGCSTSTIPGQYMRRIKTVATTRCPASPAPDRRALPPDAAEQHDPDPPGDPAAGAALLLRRRTGAQRVRSVRRRPAHRP